MGKYQKFDLTPPIGQKYFWLKTVFGLFCVICLHNDIKLKPSNQRLWTSFFLFLTFPKWYFSQVVVQLKSCHSSQGAALEQLGRKLGPNYKKIRKNRTGRPINDMIYLIFKAEFFVKCNCLDRIKIFFFHSLEIWIWIRPRTI